ncbi:hypothetical protein C4D60_Mb09t19760 [Musa balbisiana]|uniref:UBC core domain-containing protein n=1 Tax=Musa balbisiana TaxID=52838 RepID=A0A4S8IIE1_MUSBA|nr:hypothetical protein C4D60_Mb09t19760 [Musa balbisiana]
MVKFVSTLFKKDWNPSLGLRYVLHVVRCLLIEPFPESALNEQAGKMLRETYEEYARHASSVASLSTLHSPLREQMIQKLWPVVYRNKSKFKTAPICESTTALNVDQRNKESSGIEPLSPTPSYRIISRDQIAVGVVPSGEPVVVGSSAAHRKDGLAVKAQVDKKVMDARKKSFKRL